MEDIHAEKQFRARREFLVAREGEMNVLASPYYLEAGGTVIDWELVRRAQKKKTGLDRPSGPFGPDLTDGRE
jgi:hypothetical protein